MKTVPASAFPLTDASDADLERVGAVLHRLCRPLHKPLAAAFLHALRYSLRRQELPKATVLVAAGCFPERVYFLLGGSAVAYEKERGGAVCGYAGEAISYCLMHCLSGKKSPYGHYGAGGGRAFSQCGSLLVLQRSSSGHLAA